MPNEKLLLVDDDTTLLRFLTDYLEGEGYAVQSADRGQAALRLFYEARPISSSGRDDAGHGRLGVRTATRAGRNARHLLTAKTSGADKLRFPSGVMIHHRPFSLANSGPRRLISRTSGQRSEQGAVLQVGALRVDLGRREVTVDGRHLELTPTEFRLLAALAAKPGQALAQAELVEEAWGAYRQETGSALRRYVWFLRQKIEADPNKPTRLLTVRGYGYRLEP
jgi:DNA-binding response OmpR family regulator